MIRHLRSKIVDLGCTNKSLTDINPILMITCSLGVLDRAVSVTAPFAK
ncbi:MAG TPA: hypothetical protein VN086_02730 [Candidatus Paceibacterota bacterium]|nr:hypothetical protein [Candidatus Paceibacterota bacterium]